MPERGEVIRVRALAGGEEIGLAKACFVHVSGGKAFVETAGHAFPLFVGYSAYVHPDARDRLFAAEGGARLLCFWPEGMEAGGEFSALTFAPHDPLGSVLLEMAEVLDGGGGSHAPACGRTWSERTRHEFERLQAKEQLCSGRARTARVRQLVSLQRARTLLGTPGEKVRVKFCAEMANVSVFHFTRLFLRVFGETPLQYRNRARLDYARSLLVRSRAPLGEVYELAGFADRSSFGRAFRKHYGQTPSSVRRAVEESAELARLATKTTRMRDQSHGIEPRAFKVRATSEGET